MEKSVLSIILAVCVAAVVVAGAAVLLGSDGGNPADMPQVEMPGASDSSGSDGAGAPSQGTIAPEATQSQKETEVADDNGAEPTAAPATEEPTAEPTAEETVAPEANGSGATGAPDEDESFHRQTRTVTDMTGKTVTIPYDVKRVVTLYAPAAAMVMAIDGGSAERLVGIDSDAQIDEGFKTIDPSIADKTVVVQTFTPYNTETLLSVEPDVIITSTCLKKFNPGLDDLDIPVVCIDTSSPTNIDGALTLLGDVLNRPPRATELVSYLSDKRESVQEATSEIDDDDRDGLYLSGSTPQKTFAGGKFHEKWTDIAGCRLVTAELPPNNYKPTVGMEKINLWNPDIILLSHNLDPDVVLDNSTWGEIKAVRNNRVYSVPRFVGDWASAVPESVLGMMWIANGTYHDSISFDMVQETEDFYDLFYNYDMSDDEARDIMGAFPALHGREITDMAGDTVVVPYDIERVVTVYAPAAAMVMAIDDGSADRLVGVDGDAQSDTGFNAIDHSMADKTIVLENDGSVNKETLLGTDPDVIIAKTCLPISGLDDTGVPVVMIDTSKITNIDSAVTLLGNVLNKPDRAAELVTYLGEKRASVTDITDGIAMDDRKGLYLSGSEPRYTFAGGKFHQEWTEAAGCRMVSAELPSKPYKPEAKMTQILEWNPDIVLLSNSLDPSVVLNDEQWQDISAVKNNSVYRIPRFVGDWASPVPESVLGMMWVANGACPDDVDIDLVRETEDFYNEFYSYDMSDAEANEIIGPFVQVPAAA